jgi:N-acetylmuramoyl-L-alanine amidase
MRLIIWILLTGFSVCLSAAPVKIENIRIWAAPEHTRVVFDLTGPVDHRIIHLTDPFRTVLDLSGADLADELTQPGSADRYIRRLRSASHDKYLRVVLDLKKFAHSKSFQLTPNEKYGHRLVVDIYSQEESEQQESRVAETTLDLNSPREIVIAIDAGHGGEDPGSIGSAGTYEKNVALKLARKLAENINEVHGMRAVLVREGDYYISLRDRIDKARQASADLLISIHADSFKDPRVSGSSVYVLSKRGASSEHAKWLAEKENASDLIGGVKLDDKDDILASVLLDLSQTASLEASIDVADRVLGGLKRIGKVHKPRVESAAFAVLKSPDIPSLLIETAYISNPTEEKKLQTRTYHEDFSDAILSGLEGYFRAHAPENTIIAMNPKKEYVIGHGDTLSEIASRHRVSLQSLRRANGLSSDNIRIGQKLVIPLTGS